jgi:hypothetical protein
LFFLIHGQTELRGRFNPDQVDDMVMAGEMLPVRDGRTTWYALPRIKKPAQNKSRG